MRLVMAVSRDGYLCRGPQDDMRWTGPLDKFVFKLLTMSDDQPIAVGRTTATQLPSLPLRRVAVITRDPSGTIERHPGLFARPGWEAMRLSLLAMLWPDAWLIGGPCLAEEALASGLIDRAFICHVPVDVGPGPGHARLDALRHLMPEGGPDAMLDVKGISVHVHMGRNSPWPVR